MILTSAAKLSLLTLLNSSIMLLVQIILISNQYSPSQLDQFYMGLYVIGLTSIPLTNVIQSFYSSALSSQEGLTVRQYQNLGVDCSVAFSLSCLFLTILLGYIGSLDALGMALILALSLVSVFTVLSGQYNLFKKRYYLSQLFPLIFASILLIIAVLRFPISLDFLMIYGSFACFLVLLVFGCQWDLSLQGALTKIIWPSRLLARYVNGVKRSLLVLLQILPSFYILVVVSVLLDNFPGYAAFFGFFYSFVGVLSVLLGQNLMSVLLAERAFDSISMPGEIIRIDRRVGFLVAATVIVIGLGQWFLSLTLPLFENDTVTLQYLEFLSAFYFSFVGCVGLFMLWNILRGYFISKGNVAALAMSSIVGLVVIVIMCAVSIYTQRPSLTIYALPCGLLLNVMWLCRNVNWANSIGNH